MYFVSELTIFLEHSQLLVPQKLFLFHIKLFCYITFYWTELNLFTAIDKQVLQLIMISHLETRGTRQCERKPKYPKKKPRIEDGDHGDRTRIEVVR